MINLMDIAPAFSFVVQYGFVPHEKAYNPHEFGNAMLVMKGAQFSLRFERNRGQVFVDIGNSSIGWHKLEYILEFVDSSITQQQLGEPPNPEILAKLLQKSWGKVIDSFIEPQKMSEFECFSKKKSETLLNKIFYRQ